MNTRFPYLFLFVLTGIFIQVPGLLAAPTSYCTVAREIALKGINLYADQPEKGLNALFKARESCETDLGIGYNLGLALYNSGRLDEARSIWEAVNKDHANDYKTIVNLSWLRFEMGDDEEAHILAFNGSLEYPESVALAHTKLYALFRMGRYLEAYDWLYNPAFEAPQLGEWQKMAADYVVENLWQQFHRGQRLSALRQVINFLVREYPRETAFTRAKDQLVLADIDPDAEIPYPVPLPHQVWPKSGDIDNRRDELDSRIQAVPSLQSWRKREDAYGVFVGISGYQRLPARFFGDRDARNMQLLLTKRGELIDDSQHVKLRLNKQATLENIQADLDWILTKGETNPNAKLLIYLSGLGLSANDGQEVLLVPYDGKKGQINADTAISLTQLQRRLDKLKNTEILVIVDACFGDGVICGSGDFNNGGKLVSTLFSGQGQWLFSSLSGPNQTHGSGRQGAFSYYLLKGLLGEADGVTAGRTAGAQDRWVDVAEAFHYSRQQQENHNLGTDSFFFSKPNPIRLTRIGGEQ
ncbi:MAG: caspase family protein [Magnetococcales bacterium]|nr:caspase family protein [Magnetococcales bacterium]